MADTWNHKTIISPDDALYIDGELIIKGNIVQVETTQIINKLESNTLIINSDGSVGQDGRYVVPQLVLKYNSTGQQALGWGMMHYRADDTSRGNDPGLGYMRFSTVGYPVNGAIQIQKIHTMPPDNTNSSSNIAILEGNLWTGNAGAAFAMTSAITFNITSNDNGNYTDIIPVSDSFIKAGDTVTFPLNLDPTGVVPAVYGANNSTTNRIDVDSKGRIISVVNQPISITFDQITGGSISTGSGIANSIYSVFSAGTGLTFNGNTSLPYGQFYITDTTVSPGIYGQASTTPILNVNQQGQLTSAADILINIEASQVSDFEPAVEALLGAVTIDDGTGWTAANLAYTPGVFTYTTPTRAEVRNTIGSVGDINYDSANGIISLDNTIEQDLTFTGLVDLSGATVPGFTVAGNLEVQGNLNAVNKQDLRVINANIYMNVGNTVQDSHIVIDRTSTGEANSFLRWNSTAKEWSHFDGTNEWVLVRTTDDIAEGTSNLWFTQDRVNSTIDAYLVAGDGIEFLSAIAPSNPNAFGIFADLGDYLIFDGSAQITIGSEVVTTDLDFAMEGTYNFTSGNVILPEGQESLDGYIYTELASNEAFIHMNGFNIPITPAADFGRVDNGNGVIQSGAIEIYAGTQVNPIGNANSNVAMIRGLKAGANTTIYYDPDPTSDGNVIIIDAEGLNQSEVRESIGIANISGFGNINYSTTTGVISYVGVSTSDIRNQFSASGLLNYDSGTGAFTTTADNYNHWSFITDDGIGEEQDITSNERVTFQGGTGISVTNTGSVVTIVNTNTSADITGVIAGDGLTGGGTSGAVTLNVGAGTGISVAADSISVSGLTVAEFSGAAIQTSAEAFSDSDTVLMTAAAIDDRILSYGYTTNTGDITSVVAGAGLTGGGTSGSVTLNTGEGFGITVNSNDVAINTSEVRSLFSGSNGITYNSSTGDISLNSSYNATFNSVTTTQLTTGATGTAGTITGQWSLTAGSTLTATYADLAEKYKSDKQYEPGTVVVVGGEAEVTACHSFMNKCVAGVVSANPAFVMNEGLAGGVMVALKGRVPVKVSGQVKKGDLLVTADELGCATSAQTDDVPPTAVVGIALKDSEMGWTEVKV